MSRSLLWIAAALLCSACTTSTVRERHYFLAYDERGETNLYRVRVTATGNNSQAHFRSGLFPSDAVDAVFGEVKPETDPQREIDSLRKAVLRTAERYGKLLLQRGDVADEQVEAALVAWQEARAALQERMQEHGDRGARGLAEKFVFVFSTDPSDVIRHIKEFVERQELSRTLAHLLQSQVEEEALVARESLRRLARSRASYAGLILSLIHI